MQSQHTTIVSNYKMFPERRKTALKSGIQESDKTQPSQIITKEKLDEPENEKQSIPQSSYECDWGKIVLKLTNLGHI